MGLIAQPKRALNKEISIFLEASAIKIRANKTNTHQQGNKKYCKD